MLLDPVLSLAFVTIIIAMNYGISPMNFFEPFLISTLMASHLLLDRYMKMPYYNPL